MAAKRVLASGPAVAICKSHHHHHLKSFLCNPLISFSPNSLPYTPSLADVMRKVLAQRPCLPSPCIARGIQWAGYRRIHSVHFRNDAGKTVGSPNHEQDAGADGAKVKRKKLKGRRAVVRWLKFFRWKKKKEYQRMTAEEKILYKLKKAQRKEERFVQALKKIEPAEGEDATHDPEILTPEEHFFFLKMGLKCKNYVPIGRRGIYQGVILNMHLHWKKHQTLKVIVKTFSSDEVKEIAAELARLSGGIVLDIHEESTIIMYRGKNYVQPPTEIMSPRVTLSRKKALDKSKYRDGLRAVRKYIPRLQQELELLQAQAERKVEDTAVATDQIPDTVTRSPESKTISGMSVELSEKVKAILDGKEGCSEDDSDMELGTASDTEDLSDIFETDNDTDSEDTTKRPLYLDEFEKFPVEGDGEPEDFEEHLRQISLESKKSPSSGKDVNSPSFDEVDRMFLRAASLLKKKKR